MPVASLNRLVLTAQLVERGPVRFTPAGLPALDLMLAHESIATEDGQPRKVAMQIRAVAIGQITQALAGIELGRSGRFAGFLANTRNGRGLLFHLTSLDIDPRSDTSN